MGTNALEELVMAGVKWELAETPVKQAVKNTPLQQTFANVTNRIETKPLIVPI
ncbi:MAG: hypothetical protein IKZ49_04120 [Alphaproteobacteria bacterium]|nr:hypothetical protein [Alphaproteobacteria bacterium]